MNQQQIIEYNLYVDKILAVRETFEINNKVKLIYIEKEPII